MAIRKIDDNLTVTLMNNYDGGIFLQSKNGEVLVDVTDYGELTDVLYVDLRKIISTHRELFKSLTLVIVDTNDSEYGIKDVVKALRLEKEYESIWELNDYLDRDFDEESLIDFITDSDTEEFEKMIQTSLRKAILGKAVTLYRENELKDYDKVRLVGDNARAWYGEPQTFWNDVVPIN